MNKKAFIPIIMYKAELASQAFSFHLIFIFFCAARLVGYVIFFDLFLYLYPKPVVFMFLLLSLFLLLFLLSLPLMHVFSRTFSPLLQFPFSKCALVGLSCVCCVCVEMKSCNRIRNRETTSSYAAKYTQRGSCACVPLALSLLPSSIVTASNKKESNQFAWVRILVQMKNILRIQCNVCVVDVPVRWYGGGWYYCESPMRTLRICFVSFSCSCCILLLVSRSGLVFAPL